MVQNYRINDLNLQLFIRYGWKWYAYSTEFITVVICFSWQRFSHFFLTTFLKLPQILSTIGQTLKTFIDIVKCKPNYDWNYWRSWQRGLFTGTFVQLAEPSWTRLELFYTWKSSRHSKVYSFLYIPVSLVMVQVS